MKKYLLLLLVLFSVCLSAQKAPRNSRAFRPGASGTVKGTDASGNVDDIVPEVQMYIVGKSYPDSALVNVSGVIYRNVLNADNSNAIPGTGWDIVEDNFDVARVADYTTLAAFSNDQNAVIVTDENTGGTFVRDATATTVDGGIVPVSGWRRSYTGNIKPEWFGAVVDDANSDRAAVLAAIAAANGKTIKLSSGVYIVEIGDIPDSDFHLMGDGVPTINADTTALEKGTIFLGGGIFSGSNIIIENMGFDRGGGIATTGDGLKISGTGSNIVVSNVIAMAPSPTVGHAFLIEGYENVTLSNITGALGQFGAAIKSKKGSASGITVIGSQTGIILKSDSGFGQIEDFTLTGLKVLGTDDTAHGLRVLSETENVKRVSVDGLVVTNSERAVTVETDASQTTSQLSISNVTADSIRSFGIVASGDSRWTLTNMHITEVFSRSGQILDGQLTISNFKAEQNAAALTADNFRVESAVDLFNANTFDIGGIGFSLYAVNVAGENYFKNINAKVTGTAAIPDNGYTTENVDDGIVNPDFSEDGKSTIKVTATANVTITSIATNSPQRNDWPEGYQVTIIPSSSFDFTFDDNANLVNRSGDVVKSINQTIAYEWNGTAWLLVNENATRFKARAVASISTTFPENSETYLQISAGSTVQTVTLTDPSLIPEDERGVSRVIHVVTSGIVNVLNGGFNMRIDDASATSYQLINGDALDCKTNGTDWLCKPLKSGVAKSTTITSDVTYPNTNALNDVRMLAVQTNSGPVTITLPPAGDIDFNERGLPHSFQQITGTDPVIVTSSSAIYISNTKSAIGGGGTVTIPEDAHVTFYTRGDLWMLSWSEENTMGNNDAGGAEVTNGADATTATALTTKQQMDAAILAALGENGTFAATTDASGDVTIPHTLGAIPGYYQITVDGTGGRHGSPHTATTTNFKVRVTANGAAVASTAVIVYWQVKD